MEDPEVVIPKTRICDLNIVGEYNDRRPKEDDKPDREDGARDG